MGQSFAGLLECLQVQEESKVRADSRGWNCQRKEWNAAYQRGTPEGFTWSGEKGSWLIFQGGDRSCVRSSVIEHMQKVEVSSGWPLVLVLAGLCAVVQVRICGHKRSSQEEGICMHVLAYSSFDSLHCPCLQQNMVQNLHCSSTPRGVGIHHAFSISG